MSAIRPCPLPPGALLAKYADGSAFTDCWTTDIARSVSRAEYVEVFYTGGLFRIERLLLSLFLGKPSTDAELRQLAAGELDRFSAWRVEGRAEHQLLMSDIGGRTRSWFMVSPIEASAGTRLYFGSAVVPAASRSGGEPRMGFVFHALSGLHKLYSRALLASARSRLER